MEHIQLVEAYVDDQVKEYNLENNSTTIKRKIKGQEGSRKWKDRYFYGAKT